MSHRDPRQQHLEFLQKALTQVEAELSEVESLLLNLRESRAYFKREIERVKPITNNPASSEDFFEEAFLSTESEVAFNSATPEENLIGGETASTYIDEDEEFEDGDFEDEDYEELEEEGKRNPKDMLKPEYKADDLTLGDAIEVAFQLLGNGRFSSDDIAQILFEASSLSSEDYFRARNSLATELRRGATDKGGSRWKKVGRGMFMSNLAYDQFQSKQPTLSALNGVGAERSYINRAENLDS